MTSTSTNRFLVLTFAVTWSCYGGAALVPRTADQLSTVAVTLLYIGTFAPSFVAVALAAFSGERGATLALIRSAAQWRVHIRWYVFAIAYMLSIKSAAAAIQRVIVGQWPPAGAIPWFL